MCQHRCLCGGKCVQRSKLGVSFNCFSTLIFFLYLPLAWNLPNRLNWLARKPKGSSCTCLLSIWITDAQLYLAFYVDARDSRS